MASSSIDAAIALTRLGMGARPGELDRVAAAQGFRAEHHRLDVLGVCADCA
jgi:uncharacterized protein (DUF1800 family)